MIDREPVTGEKVERLKVPGSIGFGTMNIGDEPLYERYQSRERLLGATVIERRILHHMLFDNHMELGVLE